MLDAHSTLPKIPEGCCTKNQEGARNGSVDCECSAIIQRKVISDKKEDPGSFTLPCMLGPLSFKNSLCDLGSSSQPHAFVVAKRLGYHKYQACGISLVLADSFA
ncbi:unnamed protein product [Microthlaspi erraticum]|uniref:Uncharacterized protein n=1 Tax=Microthlaspi erraticum TaxID=1685480 RepID=A0A6D2JRL6_9BRAS|nr:unnamed protein product [Microthlaspi erraticum]